MPTTREQLDTIRNADGEIVDVDGVLSYLDDLRVSGVVNMFGASSYVAEVFDVCAKDARALTMYWMETFSERHPED